MLQALWDGAADSDLAGRSRAASDDASEGVQAAAQREALRAVEAVERTRNQAVQLNSSDLLGAIARRRRDAQSEASTVRDEEAPAAAAVALVTAPRFVLREHTPPTTDELLQSSRTCGTAHRSYCCGSSPSDGHGVWRRKRWSEYQAARLTRGRTPCGHGAKHVPGTAMIMRLPYGT